MSHITVKGNRRLRGRLNAGMLAVAIIAGLVCTTLGMVNVPRASAALPLLDRSVFDRKDLVYGNEIGAWDMDGGTAVNNATARANITAAQTKIIRWGIWKKFDYMNQGQQESMTVAQFNNTIDGIRNLGAYPILKLPPIWQEQCDGAQDYWNLDWLKEVVKQAGSRVQLYEFANEPDNYCHWDGNTYANYWNQTVPALKAYARSLGFEIYVGGPAMANSYSWSVSMITDFMNSAKAQYQATGNRDYVPDFVSTHMYPNSIEDPTLTDILNRINYWGTTIDAIHASVDQTWSGVNDPSGQPLAPQIKVAVSEYNYTINNSDTRANDANFIDQYERAMLGMFASHDVWMSALFTIASHTGGALDMLNTDGTAKPLYTTFKSVSTGGQLPPPPPVPTTLQNASLETDANGDQIADCWMLGGWGTNTYSWQRVTGGHNSTYAEKLTISKYTNGDRAFVSSQSAGDNCAMAANPGHTYAASAWYKSTKQVFLYFYYLKDGVWTWAGQSTAQPASTSWRKATWTTPVVPEGATRVGMGVAMKAVGNMTVDDFSLTSN